LERVRRVLDELLNLFPPVSALGYASLFAGILLDAVAVFFVDPNTFVSKLVDQPFERTIWVCPPPHSHPSASTTSPDIIHGPESWVNSPIIHLPAFSTTVHGQILLARQNDYRTYDKGRSSDRSNRDRADCKHP
jgi:hypothetical protein